MTLDLGPDIAQEAPAEHEAAMGEASPATEITVEDEAPEPWPEPSPPAEQILDSAARLLILKSMGQTLNDRDAYELRTFVARYRAALGKTAISEETPE